MHQLGVGHRLSSAPTSAMKTALESEMGYAHYVARWMDFVDLAHCVVLHKAGVIPDESARILVDTLKGFSESEDYLSSSSSTKGDIYDHRDAALQNLIGEDSGWLHTARARREAISLAWCIELRHLTVSACQGVSSLVRSIVEVSQEHRETIMPDFTYLQHAHPTTLGHYLSGFAFPLIRDLSRLVSEFGELLNCPGGSVSTNGSRFDLDRDLLAALLGFKSVSPHDRDSMWKTDLAIGLSGIIVSSATTIDRLVEELLLWSTVEFGFFDSSDQHCRTSVIMPQKKNPYALCHIRGGARMQLATFCGIVSTNLTPSGNVDNRTASYRSVPDSLNWLAESSKLLGEIIKFGSFNPERMLEMTNTGCCWGTELVDFLILSERIDTRTAHSLVGSMVAKISGNETVDDFVLMAQEQYLTQTGKAMSGSRESLEKVFSPSYIVSQRSGKGSCSPASMELIIEDLEASLSELDTVVSEVSFPDHEEFYAQVEENIK